MQTRQRIVLFIGVLLMAAFLTCPAAFADDGGAGGLILAGLVGALIVGIITASVLVSMSRTKHKATAADHYVSSDVKVSKKTDRFIKKVRHTDDD